MRIKDGCNDEKTIEYSSHTARRDHRSVEKGETFNGGRRGRRRCCKTDLENLRGGEGVKDGMTNEIKESGMTSNVKNVWINEIKLEIVDSCSCFDCFEERKSERRVLRVIVVDLIDANLVGECLCNKEL